MLSWAPCPRVPLLPQVPSQFCSRLLNHGNAWSVPLEHQTKKTSPDLDLWKALHCLGFWLLLSSWASPGHTVWPELDALRENCRGRPDLWLCYYCVLEFLQPHAPWRIPALSLGHISQTTEEISKMLGTSCVTVSPPAPRYRGPFVCSQREEETDKGQELGVEGEASSRHLCAWFVLPQDNVPSFLTKTVITVGPVMCGQCWSGVSPPS